MTSQHRGPENSETGDPAANGVDRDPAVAPPTVSAQIRAFLAGKTDGATLLHTLYDHVLDEAVPARLRALLHRVPPDRR